VGQIPPHRLYPHDPASLQIQTLYAAQASIVRTGTD
jgi:hypothetical protein